MNIKKTKEEFEDACKGFLATLSMLKKAKKGRYSECPALLRWISYYLPDTNKEHKNALNDLFAIKLYPSRALREKRLCEAIEECYRLGYISEPERDLLLEECQVLFKRIRVYKLIYIFL